MPSCNYNLTSALKPFYTFISRSSSIVCLLSIYNVHITVFSFFPRFRNAHILSFFVCFLHIHCLNINTVIFGSLSPWLNVYCTWCPQFWALCHPCVVLSFSSFFFVCIIFFFYFEFFSLCISLCFYSALLNCLCLTTLHKVHLKQKYKNPKIIHKFCQSYMTNVYLTIKKKTSQYFITIVFILYLVSAMLCSFT